MRVIPVLDVKAGQAVRAFAGKRANYEPLTTILHEGSDPEAIARAYRDVLGLREIYVADLDAITIARQRPNLRLLQELTGGMRRAGNGGFGAAGDSAGRDDEVALWVDAGVRDAGDVAPLRDAGVSVIVVGLETVRGPEALRRIVRESSPERVALSVDLYHGKPIVNAESGWGTEDPLLVAEAGLELGVIRLILLDLARVGTSEGVGTTGLLQVLRSRYPKVEIVVGGGVARASDLTALARAGASAVLVGSALHDGRIVREDCMAHRVGTV